MSRYRISDVKISWKTLAYIDTELTKQYIDCPDVYSHKIAFGKIHGAERKQSNKVQKFLDMEYKVALQCVQITKVDYLPQVTFTPLGVFSKMSFSVGSVVPGLTGFLSEMASEDFQEGVNDFSHLTSARLNKSWLMLGPLAFVNASCNPNIIYTRTGSVLKAKVCRDIAEGEELLVFYDRHFFGEFNVNCLCASKEKHGEPFANKLPDSKQKKRSFLPLRVLQSTPKRSKNTMPRSPFHVRDPRHRYRTECISQSESSSSDSSGKTLLDFHDVFHSDEFPTVSSIDFSQSEEVNLNNCDEKLDSSNWVHECQQNNNDSPFSQAGMGITEHIGDRRVQKALDFRI